MILHHPDFQIELSFLLHQALFNYIHRLDNPRTYHLHSAAESSAAVREYNLLFSFYHLSFIHWRQDRQQQHLSFSVCNKASSGLSFSQSGKQFRSVRYSTKYLFIGAEIDEIYRSIVLHFSWAVRATGESGRSFLQLYTRP